MFDSYYYLLLHTCLDSLPSMQLQDQTSHLDINGMCEGGDRKTWPEQRLRTHDDPDRVLSKREAAYKLRRFGAQTEDQKLLEGA